MNTERFVSTGNNPLDRNLGLAKLDSELCINAYAYHVVAALSKEEWKLIKDSRSGNKIEDHTMFLSWTNGEGTKKNKVYFKNYKSYEDLPQIVKGKETRRSYNRYWEKINLRKGKQ